MFTQFLFLHQSPGYEVVGMQISTRIQISSKPRFSSGKVWDTPCRWGKRPCPWWSSLSIARCYSWIHSSDRKRKKTVWDTAPDNSGALEVCDCKVGPPFADEALCLLINLCRVEVRRSLTGLPGCSPFLTRSTIQEDFGASELRGSLEILQESPLDRWNRDVPLEQDSGEDPGHIREIRSHS